MKYVVKQRIIYWQYFVVEANSSTEALQHWPDQDECTILEPGEFVNLKAQRYEPGSLVCCGKFAFIVITYRNLHHTIRKLLKRIGRRPVFMPIDETKMKPLNSKNPLFK